MPDFDMNAVGLYDLGKRYGAARSVMGQTANDRAKGFVKIRVDGIDALAQSLIGLAGQVAADGMIVNVVRQAGRMIEQSYRGAAEFHDATGNLAKSTKTRVKTYLRAVVAIVGPEQTGKTGATTDRPSGNHAWLVEYGSGPRRPGTQNRRTYVNVHQSINGRMTRHSATNDEAFARMGKGYYYLMGSLREPTRQARRGRGYTHDFVPSQDSPEQTVPMTLQPGETYGAMPAYHLMERTIQHEAPAVRRKLEEGLARAIARTVRRQGAA